MTTERAEKLKGIIDNRIMVAGVKSGDHCGAVRALMPCVMGQIMITAYEFLYMGNRD